MAGKSRQVVPGAIGVGVGYFAAIDATAINAVKTGSTIIRGVRIDASANSEAVYVKLANGLTVVPGTTPIDIVLRCSALSTMTYLFWTPAVSGITFGTGLSLFCVQEAGGGAGDTSPTGIVNVTVIYD